MESVEKTFCRMPTIETERLILRKMKRGDAKDMFEYASREDVTEFLLWYPHPDVGFTEDYLDYVESQYRTGEYYDFAVTLKENGKMIGTCGFNRFDTENSVTEIGYVLNPVYQGKGYATEAVSAVIRFGFIEVGVNRIEARHMAGNDRSAAVMKRAGMTYEGTMRDSIFVKNTYKTISVYAILKKDFVRLEIERNNEK